MTTHTTTQPQTASAAPAAPTMTHAPALSRSSLWRMRMKLAVRSFRDSWAIFASNKIGLIGLAIIVIFALMAVLHPILMRSAWPAGVYDPITGFDMRLPAHPAPPSPTHLLGTDPFGRDVLSQLMYSTASEFALGLVAAIVTVVIGTTIGAIAAYFGGAVDAIFMRLADIAIMLPAIVLLIVVGSLFKLDLPALAVVIGLLSGFGGATVLIKSQALTIKVRAYVDAARIAGGSHWHIIASHIIPNLLPLSFLYMMFTVTEAIFSEAVLSFFGLINVRMSWGLMINTAQTSGYLLNLDTWWLIVPAGLAITLLCSAFYLVGRALDEVVNPRLRKR